MRLGLQLPSFTYPGGTPALRSRLAEIAGTAESSGFASLWVMDHLFQLPEDTGWGGPEEPMLEAYSTLGYLAGVTSNIRLGALVGCAMFRELALDEVDMRPGRMTPGDVVARARAQADAGVEHLIVNMPDAWDVRHLELIGRDVIPALEAVAAA